MCIFCLYVFKYAYREYHPWHILHPTSYAAICLTAVRSAKPFGGVEPSIGPQIEHPKSNKVKVTAGPASFQRHKEKLQAWSSIARLVSYCPVQDDMSFSEAVYA